MYFSRRNWKALKLSCWIACHWGVPRLYSQLLLRRFVRKAYPGQLGRTWWRNWKTIWLQRRAPWCKYCSAACCSVKICKFRCSQTQILVSWIYWFVHKKNICCICSEKCSYISLKRKKKGKIHLLILNWENVFKLIAWKTYMLLFHDGGGGWVSNSGWK